MKIQIITTQHRDSSGVVKFWSQHGWEPVIHDNTGRSLGQRRNEILDEFYDSSEPWLALADDDMIIDTQRGWAQHFLHKPTQLLDSLGQDITSWGLMNNIHHRVDITLNNPALQDNWVFYRSSWIGCLMFHRNTGQRFYHHPTDVLEDMNWCLDQIQAGHRVATCMNLVQKNTGGSRSTIFTNQQDRRSRYQKAKQRIASEYPGITLTSQGRLIKSRFLNQFWQQDAKWSSIKDIGPSLKIPKWH